MIVRPCRSFRPALSDLEARAVPAAGLFNGVLTVIGSDVGETISISKVGTQLVLGGSQSGQFAANSVRSIVIDAKGGNDAVTVDAVVFTATRLFGGSGNDSLTGGGAADEMYGGHGNDNLSGRNGNDTAWGGPGTDTLSGGRGTNRMNQGSANRVRNAPTADETTLANLINQERALAGLAPLSVSPKLSQAAYLHSQNQAGADQLAHDLLPSSLPTPSGRADYVGYEWGRLSENVASSWRSSGSVVPPAEFVAMWMNSSGHRANILDANVTQIGVGLAQSPSGAWYATAVFGRPY